MEGVVVRKLSDVPPVGTARARIRDWLPLRAELGISAFGVNAFVGHAAGDTLIEPHSEAGVSEHEELYVVLSGAALFKIGEDREVELQRHSLLFIRDPAVRRVARASAPGTIVLVVGAPRGSAFTATQWETKNLATYGRRETH